jgi:hypothetical protein
MTGIIKISRESLGEKEGRLYAKLYRHLVESFEIDEIAADQIATALIIQKCVLLPRLLSGEDIDINQMGESVRKWLSEYRLTPKSREKEKEVTINLSSIIEEIHRERRDKS